MHNEGYRTLALQGVAVCLASYKADVDIERTATFFGIA